MLEDGAFAQVPAKATKAFSEEGQKIYSQAAGRPIQTVNDLADALKQGYGNGKCRSAREKAGRGRVFSKGLIQIDRLTKSSAGVKLIANAQPFVDTVAHDISPLVHTVLVNCAVSIRSIENSTGSTDDGT